MTYQYSHRLYFLLVLVVFPTTTHAWIFQRIQNDYQALTRRVTARHILLPPKSEDLCLTLKQKIRNSHLHVVDAFAQAAERYSRDDDTKDRGGLLGELVPQGYCRSAELDAACFQVRLGVVEGPIETEYGTHLLLVTERTNCPRLDGVNTKLVASTEKKEGVLVPSAPVGQVDLSFAAGQAAFWIFVFFAGGILAEVVSRLSA